MKGNRKICVGMITSAHGVKGLVRLRSFTEDPEAVVQYGPLTDEDGKTIVVKLKSMAKDFFIAEVKGVASKEAADALRGTKLYVPREAMPKTAMRQFYEADLIGLAAADDKGKSYGTVQAVHNHGGGPFLEIGTTSKDSFMLPFTDACVPEVDIGAGRVTIALPEGWLKAEKGPHAHE
jgi:16S rRNA processing protein RimM